MIDVIETTCMGDEIRNFMSFNVYEHDNIHDKLYIVAGNKKQALDYVRSHHMNFIDVIDVYDSSVLRGIRDIKYVLIGTCWQRDDIIEIIDMIEICGGVKVDDDMYADSLYPEVKEPDIIPKEMFELD